MSSRRTREPAPPPTRMERCRLFLGALYGTGDLVAGIHEYKEWRGRNIYVPDAIHEEVIRVLRDEPNGAAYYGEMVLDRYALRFEDETRMLETALAKKNKIKTGAIQTRMRCAFELLSTSELLSSFVQVGWLDPE